MTAVSVGRARAHKPVSAGGVNGRFSKGIANIIGLVVLYLLQRIQCPTLLITADRDYTPVSRKEAYVKELPNARLVVIENSRHATPLDQPERFNATLLDFLAEVERNKEPKPC